MAIMPYSPHCSSLVVGMEGGHVERTSLGCVGLGVAVVRCTLEIPAAAGAAGPILSAVGAGTGDGFVAAAGR